MQELSEFDYSTLLASSIHEVKNSLNMLLNTIDNVSGSCDNHHCGTRESLSYIKYEGTRISDDLIELLAIYRIRNNQYMVNIDEHSVSAFLNEILMQHETTFRYRNIQQSLDCSDDLIWYFDRDLLSVVMSNVINNLYKYTRDRLEISADQSGDYLLIQIRDNGEGYPDWMLSPETTQKQALRTDMAGTGLGLYFSRLVCGIHKNKGREGYITTTNDGIEGGGCFSIYLP
jgi:K+-sensing histidine kinase KdpD